MVLAGQIDRVLTKKEWEWPKKPETTTIQGVCRDYIRQMEKNMETTLGFRAWGPIYGLGFRAGGIEKKKQTRIWAYESWFRAWKRTMENSASLGYDFMRASYML